PPPLGRVRSSRGSNRKRVQSAAVWRWRRVWKRRSVHEGERGGGGGFIRCSLLRGWHLGAPVLGPCACGRVVFPLPSDDLGNDVDLLIETAPWAEDKKIFHFSIGTGPVAPLGAGERGRHRTAHARARPRRAANRAPKAVCAALSKRGRMPSGLGI